MRKDEDGRLYLAATDSDLQSLSATTISAEFISGLMTKSRSQVVVLVLDCCYSGAFMSGMEYAFESSGGVSGEGAASIFADAFVRSLATGDADRDRDGWVYNR